MTSVKLSLTALIALFLSSACGAEINATLEAPAPTGLVEETATPFLLPTATTSSTPAVIQPSMLPATTPVSMRVSTTDGMTEIQIPSGILHMGGLDVYAENDELPPHDVELEEFWIDQLEITNSMYNLCVQTGACAPPVKFNSDNRPDYFYNLEFRDYPVVYVSWLDASQYCQWAGRRLPTEAEWERAARGDDLRTYPWGDELPNPTLLNFNNEVSDTSRVGSYQAGASPFSVLDMAGNVWEWTADLYKSNFYLTSALSNPTGPSEVIDLYQRVLRGGSFQDERVNVRLSNRGYELGPDRMAAPQDPAYYGRSSVRIGFRCASTN